MPDPFIRSTESGDTAPTHLLGPTPQLPRRRRKPLLWSGIGVLTAAVAGLTLVAVTSGYQPPESGSGSQPPNGTSLVSITTGNLVSETNTIGIVRYSKESVIASTKAGVITELPDSGTVIGVGDILYRVNMQPVVLLSGPLPAWRDFTAGMTDGEDVRQIEQNLRSLNYFSGEPDTAFGPDTEAAIKQWQASLGLEQTGVAERSSLLFFEGELRVGRTESRVGADITPGTTMYEASSPDKVIEVKIKSANRALAEEGKNVDVMLPGGGKVTGLVKDVAEPVSEDNADGSTSVVIPARVVVEDQNALTGLSLANITVKFPTVLKEDALTVPVDALVPINDTDFAVELVKTTQDPGRTLVPVVVGSFASGIVEISGNGIVDGAKVVVPG